VGPHGATDQRVEIDGEAICIHEWRGSGPATMHVHREDGVYRRHASELLE
jgi:hypothetical protein